jgi:hypothetical protein
MHTVLSVKYCIFIHPNKSICSIDPPVAHNLYYFRFRIVCLKNINYDSWALTVCRGLHCEEWWLVCMNDVWLIYSRLLMLCQVVLAVDLVLDRLDGLTFLNHVHTSGSHRGTAVLHLIQFHFQPICTQPLSSPSFISIGRYFALPLFLLVHGLCNCIGLPSAIITTGYTSIRSLTIISRT